MKLPRSSRQVAHGEPSNPIGLKEASHVPLPPVLYESSIVAEDAESRWSSRKCMTADDRRSFGPLSLGARRTRFSRRLES